MNIKGDYSGLTSYSVGDVVRCDGVMYVLMKPAASGTTPTNSLYWDRMPQPLADAAELIVDSIIPIANNLTTTTAGKALDARKGKELKQLIDGVGDELDLVYPDSKTLVLLSSTASSTKRFAITVNDDAELTATEITT